LRDDRSLWYFTGRVRRFLLFLLLSASALLIVILIQSAGDRQPWSPFALVCLGVYLGFLAILALSVIFYAKRPALIQNFWLAFLTSAICLVAFDAIAQRLKQVDRYAPVLPDPIVHHRLWPATSTTLQTEDFRVTLDVNRYGMRGKEPESPKPAGTFRLIMLGDSFTMGEGVADDQAFPALLEKSLASRLPVHVEVLNAGVDSYAPILSYLDLRENLFRWEPDAVVLGLDLSDLLQEQYYRSLAVRGADGDFLAVPNPRLRGRTVDWLDDFIKRRLYFLRYAYMKLRERFDAEVAMEKVIQRRNGDLIAYTLATDTVDRTQQWNDLFDSIVRIRRLCRQKGVLFFLALYPWGHEVNEREWIPGRDYWMPHGSVATDRPFDAIRNRCVDNDIPLLDTLAAFRGYRGDSPLYFRHDMHWTPEGHRVMSEALRMPLEAAIRGSLKSGAGGTPGPS
jgi:hypothetical protein